MLGLFKIIIKFQILPFKSEDGGFIWDGLVQNLLSSEKLILFARIKLYSINQ